MGERRREGEAVSEEGVVIRRPRHWRWGRVVGYVVIPAAYVGLLFWALGPVAP